MLKKRPSGPVFVKVVDFDSNLIEAIFVPGAEGVPALTKFLENLFESDN